MKSIVINGKWSLLLPEHRAERNNWAFWEYERNAAMYAAIRPGDVIVDVGAEEGDLSALYASWAGSEGKIHLVEPSPKMWPWIRQTFKGNGLSDRIAQEFVGFAGKESIKGEIQPTDIETYPDPGFAHINENDGTIPQITLDDWIDTCDVITMDVEGGEYDVLLGAKRLLTEERPIVFISVHPEMLRERYNMTPDDLFVLMEHHYGYTGIYLGYDHEYHHMFKPKS